MTEPPKSSGHLALVLSGGGAQAAYQVGVMRAIAESFPSLAIPIITGVSAGAINAAHFAAHPGPLAPAVDSLRAKWGRLTSQMIYEIRTVSLARMTMRWLRHMSSGGSGPAPAVRGLMETRPLRDFLRKEVDFNGIDANIAAGRLRAVALSATSFSTGYSVTFVQGLPDLAMWERARRVGVRAKLTLDHVMASSAIPLVFPAVRLDGAFYGDGSVRQDSPLAPAIHLGSGRILAIATQPAPGRVPRPAPTGEHPSTIDTITLLLDSLFLDALDADAERLIRINRILAALPAGAPAPGGLAPVALLMLRPSRDLGSVARECMRRIEKLPQAIQLLIRAMGVTREAGAGFLSYFLFEPEYTGKLVELGYADGQAQMATAIRPFLTATSPPP